VHLFFKKNYCLKAITNEQL